MDTSSPGRSEAETFTVVRGLKIPRKLHSDTFRGVVPGPTVSARPKQCIIDMSDPLVCVDMKTSQRHLSDICAHNTCAAHAM